MRSYAHLPTRLCRDRFSSLELLAQLDEAAGNAAGDRAGGQFEGLADRAVRLVPREEAVEDLLAVLGQARHRVVDVERLVDPPDRVLVGICRELAFVGRLFTRARSQPVNADASGQLGDPGLDRLVAAERVEPLVDLGEDLLEDVLGVLVAQTEALARDRVHVAGEAFDEGSPRLLVAATAAGDELRGRNRLGHGRPVLGGFGGIPLVAGVRWSFPGEDAGSVHIHRYGRDCETRAEPVASSAARRHRLYFAKPS